MRPGIVSYTEEEDDKTFMEVGPLLMTSLAERLASTGGPGAVENVIVTFQRVSVLIMKVKDGHVAISAERADAVEIFLKAVPIVRQRFC